MTTARPKVAILGFFLEANAFAPKSTEADFRASLYYEGEAMLVEAARPAPAIRGEITGFIQAMKEKGPWEPAPIIFASVEPGGPVEAGFFKRLLGDMRDRLKMVRPLDGVYIANHGAALSTEGFDPDGELYALVREAVGPNVPIVTTVDLHANISERMVQSVEAIVSYRTNPHVDRAERAVEAADLLTGLMAGRKLEKFHLRLPIVAPSVRLLTKQGLYADLINQGQAALGPDLALVSVVGGFAFADSPKNGLTILTYGQGDRPKKLGLMLAAEAWTRRAEFEVQLTSLQDAVAQASAAGESAGKPAVCLADVADNPGGGGRGNTTEILQGLLQAGARKALLGLFVDPALAKACHERGIGAEFEAEFNSRASLSPGTGRFHRRVKVLALSDGRIVGRRGTVKGRLVNLGPAAAVQMEGLTVAVITRRLQGADPAFFEALGLDIASFRSLTIKSRGHFRAGFDEFFSDDRIIEVDAAGLTSPVLSRFDFKHLPRPVFPLDRDFTWSPPVA